MAAKVVSKSSGPRTSTGTSSTLSVAAIEMTSSTASLQPTGLLAFEITAAFCSDGSMSLSRSSRLAASSGVKMLSPVIFPPGRDKLDTMPSACMSATAVITIGIVLVAPHRCKRSRYRVSQNDIYVEVDQFGCECRQSIVILFGPAGLDDDVLTFDIAELAQPGAQRLEPRRVARR